jgi:hypothetical protein
MSQMTARQISPQSDGQRRLRGRHVHDDHGHHHRERRATHHLPRAFGAAQPGGRRIHRIPGQPGGIHPGLGLAGRPVRQQTGFSGRSGHLHVRLGAMRAGAKASGNWSPSGSCRASVAGCSPPPGWRCCTGRSRRMSGSGSAGSSPSPPGWRPRWPGARGHPGHRRFLAVGVLRERAHRRGRVRVRRGFPARAPGSRRRPVRPAGVLAGRHRRVTR